MPYSLKSNATTAAATIVWVADNGLTNLVDASAVTATGTVATSTQAGKLVYGDAAAQGNYLNATAAAAIAAGQKFSILLVAHAGRTWVDDHRHVLTPSNKFNVGNFWSPVSMLVFPADWGGQFLGQALTGYSHPSAPLHTLIWGREADNSIGTVYDGAFTSTAGNAYVTGQAIPSGTYKFAGSPQSATGDGARIFGVFVGVSPSELNTYLGADAEGALFEQPANLGGGAVLDNAAAAGTLSVSASDIGGGVTLSEAVAGGSLGMQSGIVSALALRNWSGSLQTSVTIPVVTVCRLSDGAQVLTLTNQTTHASTGDLTITSASLLVGTWYMVMGWNADGSQRFAVPLQATA